MNTERTASPEANETQRTENIVTDRVHKKKKLKKKVFYRFKVLMLV